MRLFSDSRPFYRANFHCHTTESDGRLDPDSAVRFYGDSGYDILSITDHRTVTDIGSLQSWNERPLLIPGIEIDYRLPGQWVHVLGIGMDKCIGSKWNPYGSPQEGIDLIRSLDIVYDVHRIANGEKVVPRKWINKAGNYVTEEFLDYVRPLIQGHYAPMMVEGLPRHLSIHLKNYDWSAPRGK